uniref:Uncharacterized protein n=1 Tax=Rhabditophanes sp. KR3021 TaxID=114890 RepID=A0AC35TNZ3_9BILA
MIEFNSTAKFYHADDFCHASFDDCRKNCAEYQCLPVDRCNSVNGQFFVCSFLDPKLLMYIILISFLIVLLCCSSFVACYICRYARRSFRQATYTDGNVILNNVSHIPTLPHQNYNQQHKNITPPHQGMY